MSETRFYKQGDWDAICDSCGGKYKASELRKRWDGLYVCRYDWEIRQPQDFTDSRPDPRPVPFQRPDTNVFVNLPACTPGNQQGIAGVGIAGCMIAGLITVSS